MDRLHRLTGKTNGVRPKAAAAGNASAPQSTAKPPRRNIIRVSVPYPISGAYSRNADFMYGSQCLTQNAYTCQLSIHILLHARSRDITLRPIRQDDFLQSIELEPTSVPQPTVSFDYLINSLEHQKKPLVHLRDLDELEGRLIDALKILHSNNISFPVSANVIKLVVPQPSEGPAGNYSPKLFLQHNIKARWANKNNKLPPTWKADQLASARSLFFIPKVGAPIFNYIAYMLLIRTRSYLLESLPHRVRLFLISKANKP